ncbi:hypothetical protein [Hymenobacter metallilatus]|uniref:Uncharacterized protein n=1 Tax=Hymenobacter metallilatus TaxID=2493666 RepID=A0A3R9M2I6_9BACT|nr:hypothetical protein [Hymenobacter metallilatus]RSK29858.1 hypothetical protein EI290_16105 [Hymenobacter metallilatus]
MAGKPTGAQPDTVRLRSTALGIERDFSAAHAAALHALEEKQGHHDWHEVPAPTETPAPTTADDPPASRRPRTTRKSR